MFRPGDLVKLSGLGGCPYRLVLKIFDDGFNLNDGIRVLVLTPSGRISNTGLFRDDEIVASLAAEDVS